MAKAKNTKDFWISPERLAEIQRRVLIESTGSSLRLSGSKVTNEQVEQILNAMTSKSSGQKQEPQTK